MMRRALTAAFLLAFVVACRPGPPAIPRGTPTPTPRSSEISWMRRMELEAPPLRGRRMLLAAAPAVVRGAPGDLWADIVLGRPDFTEIVAFKTVPQRIGPIGGVTVDTARHLIYVVETGNNRILALRESDGSLAFILGQPTDTDRSACNGDSGYQRYPDRAPATADSLCLLPESSVSSAETIVDAQMKVGPDGSLYAPDVCNNRVKKYSWVGQALLPTDFWGQPDWTGNSCNNNGGVPQDQFSPPPSATTLCFGAGGAGGVDLDPAGGLWVADFLNNRVMHFPPGSKAADVVLGQPNMTTGGFYHSGSGPAQLAFPRAVRLFNGDVWVADANNNRIQIFAPPFSNGMAARSITTTSPWGLEVDPKGRGVWVQSYRGGVRLYSSAGALVYSMTAAYGSGGSVGFDSTGGMWLGVTPDLCRFPPDGAGGFLPVYPNHGLFNFSDCNGISGLGGVSYPMWNLPTADRIAMPSSVEVVGDQLIVGGYARMLAWNGLGSLTSGQAADVLVGQPDWATIPGWAQSYDVIKADTTGRLWAAVNANASSVRIQTFATPLTTGAAPTGELLLSTSSPLPMLGGGTFSWSNTWAAVMGLAPIGAGDAMWISDSSHSRVFRVRHALTAPMVDVVLGQVDASGDQCNRGQFPQGDPNVTADMLCRPGVIEIDRLGNLWVADHSPEVNGNFRVLEFDASLFPSDNAAPIFATSASHILPKPTSALSMAFDQSNRLLIGYNPYAGSRFVGYYNNPLTETVPDGYLNDFHTWVNGLRFDGAGNLYLSDGNRNRVLVYYAPFGEVSATPTVVPPTATSTSSPPPQFTPTPPRPTPTKWIPPGKRKKTPSATPTPSLYAFAADMEQCGQDPYP